MKEKGKLTYLNKTMKPLAQKLAQKKYLSLLMEELQIDKSFLDSFLDNYHNGVKKSELLLTQHSAYQKLLSSCYKPISAEILEWMNASYERNPNHPENLIHTSCSGHMLRSKSESLIDIVLFMNQIPFRYECALILDGITFYPDFMIRHPQTGRIILWEHFGMMDDLNYVNNAYHKLQIYTKNGYIPSINLIVTYETKDHPLTSEAIESALSCMMQSMY